MNREVHVRFWEGLAVRFRWATQLSRSPAPCANDPSVFAIASSSFRSRSNI